MGTNYYLTSPQAPACPTCGHAEQPQRIHLGKISGGWQFLYRGNRNPDFGPLVENVFQWADNIVRHTRQGWLIRDEYGMVVTVPELRQIIEEHKSGQFTVHPSRDDGESCWADQFQNSFYGREFS